MNARDNFYIPIVFCFDGNYAKYAAVASYSAFANSKSKLKIYWVFPKSINDEVAKISAQLQKLGLTVVLKDLDNNSYHEWMEKGHLSRAIYLRFSIPELIDEKKIIYLDCDVLVLNDIADLLNTDCLDYPIAAVPDIGNGADISIPVSSDDVCINTGVLIMNLEYLRQHNFIKEIHNLYGIYKAKLGWPVQCLLNKYAENNKKIIAKKWNFQIFAQNTNNKEIAGMLADNQISILHFIGEVKPWQEWCNPYFANMWRKYADKLEIESLAPVKVKKKSQAWALARSLRKNGRYAASLWVKINYFLFKCVPKLR